MPNAGAVRIPAGEQRGPRRRAGRRDVKVGEADGLAGKRIDIRRAQDRVAVHPEVAVTLIVGHHQDDIRAPRRAAELGLGRYDFRRRANCKRQRRQQANRHAGGCTETDDDFVIARVMERSGTSPVGTPMANVFHRYHEWLQETAAGAPPPPAPRLPG